MKKKLHLKLVSIFLFFITPALLSANEEFKKYVLGNTVDVYSIKKDVSYQWYFSADGKLISKDEEGDIRFGHWIVDDDEGKLCIAFANKSAKCRPILEDNSSFGTANRKGTKRRREFSNAQKGDLISVSTDLSKLNETAEQIKEQLITLKTRPGVTLSFLLLEPEAKPKGVVVLYPGHEGVMRFKKIANQYSGESFGGGLTASEVSRQKLSRAGYAVATMSLPSDQYTGIDTAFRTSQEHTEDARYVIEFLNKKFNQNVVLHGHCRSSFSPASITTRLNNKGIKAVILSSTRSTGRYGSVMDLPKNKIKVPVLLVHHIDDPCEGTPYSNVSKLKAFYNVSSSTVDLITVKGGNGARPASAPGCSGGYHAFKGAQKSVMDAVIQWLNNESFPEEVLAD